MYSPLEKADKKWNICVSFPHMKDALHWLAVDYGLPKRKGFWRRDASRRGWRLHQLEQADIADRGLRVARAQAVVIGAISYDGSKETVKPIKERTFR